MSDDKIEPVKGESGDTKQPYHFYEYYGYTPTEWRLRTEQEHIGSAEWEQSPWEHEWNQIDD